jgi:hypothetical protein
VFTKIDPLAAAALRLLLFTGCRLREILNLRWENVDMERGSILIHLGEISPGEVSQSLLVQLFQLGPLIEAQQALNLN